MGDQFSRQRDGDIVDSRQQGEGTKHQLDVWDAVDAGFAWTVVGSVPPFAFDRCHCFVVDVPSGRDEFDDNGRYAVFFAVAGEESG